MPHFKLGCELVRGGHIGKLQRIEVTAPNGGEGGSTEEAPVPPTLDYNMWIGPAPMKPYTVNRCNPDGTYWIYDYSIGYLGGWGAHPLDIMVWGTDADLAGPMTFRGTGVIPTKGLYDTVYNWDVTVEMADGVEMTFKAAKASNDWFNAGDSTKFIGSEGWIRMWRGNGVDAIEAEPKSLLSVKIDDSKTVLAKSARHDQNFVEAVKSRTQPVSNVADAVRSDIISHMSDIAIRTGRPITWDPKAEQIVGDAEASKMLHRDMRAPWTV
jgi:hypothetical protein